MSDVVIRGLTEETFDDAAQVISTAFSKKVVQWARKFLSNPLRSFCASAGDISYKDGVPMAFQAAILRRVYLGEQTFLGVTGSTFCKVPKAKPRYVLSVFEKTEEPRGGSVMSFGNTAALITQSIAGTSGNNFGPKSCEIIKFAVLRLGSFLNFVLKGHIPKHFVAILDFFSRKCGDGNGVRRSKRFDKGLFDAFWERYLSQNKGLVLSRTTEELEWAFGTEVRTGEAYMYCHYSKNSLDGYVIFKRHAGRSDLRWIVADWIAIRDDKRILKELLSGGLANLKAETSAAFVEVIGYPMFVQEIIHQCMPFSRAAKGNCATYRFNDACLAKRFEDVKECSWFFGAYDGDRAL